jgi:hypothetical protein
VASPSNTRPRRPLAGTDRVAYPLQGSAQSGHSPPQSSMTSAPSHPPRSLPFDSLSLLRPPESPPACSIRSLSSSALVATCCCEPASLPVYAPAAAASHTHSTSRSAASRNRPPTTRLCRNNVRLSRIPAIPLQNPDQSTQPTRHDSTRLQTSTASSARSVCMRVLLRRRLLLRVARR